MPSGKRTHDVAALMDELETLSENNVLKEQTYIGLADALKLLNDVQTSASSENQLNPPRLRSLLHDFFDRHEEVLERSGEELRRRREELEREIRDDQELRRRREELEIEIGADEELRLLGEELSSSEEDTRPQRRPRPNPANE
jgi:hypothetical protein